MSPRPMISVVSPVYLAEPMVNTLVSRTIAALAPLTDNFEIVLVEDGGRDHSWTRIEECCARDPRVKGVKLSRNFGQHFAITAGLDHARGDWIVVMDCDLQDQPEEIEKLWGKAQEGFDVVFARRAERKDTFFKKASSRLFTLLYNWVGDIKLDPAIANFSISSRAAMDCVLLYRECNRSFPILLNSVGFRKGYVDVEHAARLEGRSSYTFWKLLDLAIQSMVSQSNKPLQLSIRFGFGLATLSVLYTAYLIARYYLLGVGVMGWTSIMVLNSFLFGLLFANLGILGLYLGKVFDEMKRRPLYLVEKTTNLEKLRTA